MNAGGDRFDPLDTIQWVTSAYLPARALALPLSGWLMDRLVARRIFLGCFAIISQRFGGPVGTMTLALFLQHHLTVQSPLIAYAATFWLLAALAAGALLAASRLPGRH